MREGSLMQNEELMRTLAAWALVHESADEAWKAAVVRGEAQDGAAMAGGPQAFVDGLAAMVAEEKERLKVELASGDKASDGSRSGLAEKLDELHFEVSELRGRLESMQASLDALADSRGDRDAEG